MKLIKRLKHKGIRNPAVLDAIEAVPRHLFLDPEQFDNAYVDTALPIGHAQTISQPFVVALMSEMVLTAAKNNRRVLESALDAAIRPPSCPIYSIRSTR